MDKKISILLEEIKKSTGWTQAEIAKKVGTTQPTINRILNGQSECKLKTWRSIVSLHEKTSTLEPCQS